MQPSRSIFDRTSLDFLLTNPEIRHLSLGGCQLARAGLAIKTPHRLLASIGIAG